MGGVSPVSRARLPYCVAMKRNLAPTAFHEAGHAVMAIVLRKPWRAVSIEPDEDAFGRTYMAKLGKRFKPDIEVNTRTRNMIEREVMMFLAGPEAERFKTGRRNSVGARDDYQCAGLLLGYAVGDQDELDAYLEWLRCRTVNDLRQPMFWARVELLAERLLEQRRMTRREATALVLPHLGSQEAEKLSMRATALIQETQTSQGAAVPSPTRQRRAPAMDQHSAHTFRE